MKDKLLHTAMTYFLRYGIKAVSIEDIARALHISKRTLYEYFDSKTELLKESFKYGIDLKQKEIEKNLSFIKSPIEAIIDIYITAIKQSLEICPAITKDTERYPEIEETIKKYTSFLEEKWKLYFEKAIKEEKLTAESDYKIIFKIYVGQKEWCLKNDNITETQKLKDNLQILYICMKGMCTNKGKHELEEIYESIKENNNKII